MEVFEELSDNDGARDKFKRIGRGIGSGKGKTAGRGVKGQKSRTGVAIKGFEGGQMPLYRRIPKRGFRPPHQKQWQVVNLGALQKAIDDNRLDAGKTIDAAAMQAAGLFKNALDGVRLLGKGEIKTKIEVKVAALRRRRSPRSNRPAARSNCRPSPWPRRPEPDSAGGAHTGPRRVVVVHA
jgi:large subunit ribosomal protein L15